MGFTRDSTKLKEKSSLERLFLRVLSLKKFTKHSFMLDDQQKSKNQIKQHQQNKEAVHLSMIRPL
jgi:hypothetical protein